VRRVPELNFKGKEFVYNHHLTVPFRPLLPQAEKGIGAPALDGNLIIHGDNLHGLKALLPTHAGKVDCIFIDPPYNTGNEGWCYNDNVNSPMIKEWLAANPVALDDGLRHDKWLSMMWPRLRLLHELLADNGIFWMTLDDNEAHHARAMLNEIFGVENFVSQVTRVAKRTSDKGTHFRPTKDYVFAYAKDISKLKEFGVQKQREESDYKLTDDDGRKYKKSGASLYQPSLDSRPNQRYYIEAPDGSLIIPPGDVYPDQKNDGAKVKPLSNNDKVWRWSVDTYIKQKDLLIFTQGSNSNPLLDEHGNQSKWNIYPKVYFEDDVNSALHPEDIIYDYPNSQGTKELNAMGIPFNFAKPTGLIGFLLKLVDSPDSIILDSFAGSGTTAHAVLAANARDGGNRKFILVEGEDYADSLTAERVRRVINGYDFTGTQRDELLREPLTFSKLKQANNLLEQVQRIETLDGSKYDRITKTVKDGVLIVTGERAVKERTEGLGGSFTYCELGAPIDMDGLLTGADLPDAAAMAALLYHTATAQAFDPASLLLMPAIGEGVMQLGVANGRTLWLIYKPDLDWLKSSEAALTLSRARFIAAHSAGEHLVFAPAKFVSRELLAAEKLPIEFAPLPFALYRVETA
jgi:adenine-specific DNA-methyltransferase